MTDIIGYSKSAKPAWYSFCSSAFIFHRLYKKHTLRISQKKGKHCPFSFFDVKGWIVMIGMIAMGIVIRTYHLLPDSFIAVFYTGLSLALLGTGLRFIWYWWRNR